MEAGRLKYALVTSSFLLLLVRHLLLVAMHLLLLAWHLLLVAMQIMLKMTAGDSDRFCYGCELGKAQWRWRPLLRHFCARRTFFFVVHCCDVWCVVMQ